MCTSSQVLDMKATFRAPGTGLPGQELLTECSRRKQASR